MSWRTIWQKLTQGRTERHPEQSSTSKQDLLGTDLQANRKRLENLFKDCGDVSLHDFRFGSDKKPALLLYQQGLVDQKTLNESVLRALLVLDKKTGSNLESIGDQLIPSSGQETTGELSEVVQGVFSGKTALFIDGSAQALLLETTGYEKRAVEEPSTEISVRGPRDGFIESLQTNISLVRLRIKDSRLKFVFYPLGRRSKTKVAIAYLEGLTPPQLLREVQNRLERVDMDVILDSGYIEQMIEDKWSTIFPQLQLTERPDETVAALAEGRVAILTDTTPGVLLAPVTINTLMHAPDDYYSRWILGSFIRGFRFAASIFSVVLPGLYVALTAFHPELLPTQFALAIAAARKPLPFPAFMEAFILEAFIELIREAGLRLPRNLGQAISIVGGLIIGQAAISAGIVSPLMLMVVGLTAISNFAIPNFDAAQAVRVIRFFFILLAAILGLYGISLGIIFVFAHLSMLKSFGYSYLSPWSPLVPEDLKDSIIRLPWPAMHLRPRYLTPSYNQRLSDERRDSLSKSGKENH